MEWWLRCSAGLLGNRAGGALAAEGGGAGVECQREKQVVWFEIEMRSGTVGGCLQLFNMLLQ